MKAARPARPCARPGCEGFAPPEDTRRFHCSEECRLQHRRDKRRVSPAVARGRERYLQRNAERLLAQAQDPERRALKNSRHRARYAANPEVHLKRGRAYRAANPERIRHYAEKRRGTRTAEYRRRDLMRKYGLTLEEYEMMSAQRKGCCDVCQLPERARRNGRLKSLAVDHHHRSGEIRGLLCSACNTQLGFLENEYWVALVKAYLSSPAPTIPPFIAAEDRAGRRWSYFRLTEGQFQRMAAERDQRCDICKKNEKATYRGKRRSLAVDHDPRLVRGQPGHIRGLLCGVCNTRIWMFDHPEWLHRAMTYLQSPPGKGF